MPAACLSPLQAARRGGLPGPDLSTVGAACGFCCHFYVSSRVFSPGPAEPETQLPTWCPRHPSWFAGLCSGQGRAFSHSSLPGRLCELNLTPLPSSLANSPLPRPGGAGEVGLLLSSPSVWCLLWLLRRAGGGRQLPPAKRCDVQGTQEPWRDSLESSWECWCPGGSPRGLQDADTLPTGRAHRLCPQPQSLCVPMCVHREDPGPAVFRCASGQRAPIQYTGSGLVPVVRGVDLTERALPWFLVQGSLLPMGLWAPGGPMKAISLDQHPLLTGAELQAVPARGTGFCQPDPHPFGESSVTGAVF